MSEECSRCASCQCRCCLCVCVCACHTLRDNTYSRIICSVGRSVARCDVCALNLVAHQRAKKETKKYRLLLFSFKFYSFSSLSSLRAPHNLCSLWHLLCQRCATVWVRELCDELVCTSTVKWFCGCVFIYLSVICVADIAIEAYAIVPLHGSKLIVKMLRERTKKSSHNCKVCGSSSSSSKFTLK